MKVVTLRVPICDNYWDVAEITNDEQGFASEEEYLAYLALKGICSSFQDEDTVHQMSDYFKELVRMTYNKDLAGETRQDSKEGQCEGCIFENGTRAYCCECSRGMTYMYTPKKGRRDRA